MRRFLQNLVSGAFFKNLAFFTGPDLINVFLRFFAGIITAKILGPENLGISSAVGLILVYFPLLQLGAFDGMTLKVYSLKANPENHELINDYFNTAYNFINLVLVCGAIVTVIIVSFMENITFVIWIGVCANIGAGFFYQYFNFSLVYARFEYEYKTVGQIQLFQYIIRAVFAVVLTFFFHLWGFFIAIFSTHLFSAAFAGIKVSPGFKRVFVRPYLKEMVSLGLPMILIGSLFTIYQSIDRWFILGYLNTTQLGYYSIVLTFASILLIVPVKTTSLLIQYTREYYYKTNKMDTLANAYVQSVVVCLLINLLFVTAAGEVIFFLFKCFLTKYMPSYVLVNIILLSTFFTSTFHILGGFFVVIDKKRYNLICLAISLALAAFYNGISLIIDGTIYGISVATLLSSASLCILMFWGLRRLTRLNDLNIRLLHPLFIFGLILALYSGVVMIFPHNFDSDVTHSLLTGLARLLTAMVLIAVISLPMIRNDYFGAIKKVLER